MPDSISMMLILIGTIVIFIFAMKFMNKLIRSTIMSESEKHDAMLREERESHRKKIEVEMSKCAYQIGFKDLFKTIRICKYHIKVFFTRTKQERKDHKAFLLKLKGMTREEINDYRQELLQRRKRLMDSLNNKKEKNYG